jgi:hypothetical protein
MPEMVEAYIRCALWSTNDESDEQGGKPLDERFDRSDLDAETDVKMTRDCHAFWEANEKDLSLLDAEWAGHDFWLTRNGHGSGFWDLGLGEVGDRLTEASKRFGEFDLYVGDDGKVFGR